MIQTRAEAITHYKGKVDYIRTNLETLEDTINKKKENMNAVTNVMQAKLKAQAQAQPNTQKA